VIKKGAYIFYLDVTKPQMLEVGSLGTISLPAGRYIYVGSACRGIASRLARHHRLADRKTGQIHWHIDHLLIQQHVQWAGETVREDGIECEISAKVASLKGVTAPVPGFGSSDCRAGCRAHLYLMPKSLQKSSLTRAI